MILPYIVMLELRITISYNLNFLWTLYCEPAPLSKHRLPLQADICTSCSLALNVGFQIFLPSPTYIPAYNLKHCVVYTAQTGLPIFDRVAFITNGNWYYASALISMRGGLSQADFSLPFGKYWSKLQIVSE